MAKRVKVACLLTLVGFLLTGCWDAVEVNNLNLCTLVILDKNDNRLSFTAEIARIAPAGESGGGGGKKQTFLTGTGTDFASARDDLDMQMDYPIFLGTVRALVITERAAQDDFAEYMFRLRENQEYRQKVNITVMSDEVKTLTEFEDEKDQPAGFVIDDTIHSAQALGHTCAVTTEQYINDMLTGRGFLIQHIRIQDRKIAIDGYSVFRDAKLVGFIPIADSRGLSYLKASAPVWVYRLPGDGGAVTSEVSLAHREIVPSYTDGRIRFRVQIDFAATIQYNSVPSAFPFNEQNTQKYAYDLNQVLAAEVRAAVEQSQKQFQSDYLLFGDTFRLAYPDAYDQMYWPSVYPEAEVEVNTSVDISISEKMDIEAS